MSSPSLGLCPRDFDAYLPERSSSNAYSRPRLEFKQRALTWARRVVTRLHDLGIEVEVEGSDEYPSMRNGHSVDCQWVFFWRPAEARADLDRLLEQGKAIHESLHNPAGYLRHAFLALRLDATKIEVGAQIHPAAWIDFETLCARLAVNSHAETFVQTIANLPDEFRFGVLGSEMASCSSVSELALRDLAKQSEADQQAVWVGWTVDRALAEEHCELLDDQLEDALVALGPVYRAFTFRPEDDPAELNQRLEEMRETQARQVAARMAEDERTRAERDRIRQETTEKSRERTRERVDYVSARTGVTLANLFKSDSPASGDAKPEPKRSPPPPRGGFASSEGRRSWRESGTSAGAARAPTETYNPRNERVGVARSAAGSDPLGKGARVRVLSGPFAGKLGQISELDGRGGARVLLGLLSTRLSVEDLAPAPDSRDRPALQSSHRRPGSPGRSGQ